MVPDSAFAYHLTADTAFAWRHLAQHRLENGFTSVRDTVDFKYWLAPRRAGHIAGKFAEGSFGLCDAQQEFALNNDFGGGGHFQFIRFARDHFNRLTGNSSRQCQLVNTIWNFRHSRQVNAWLTAHDKSGRHWRPGLFPRSEVLRGVLIIGPAPLNPEFVAPFDLSSIHADVFGFS